MTKLGQNAINFRHQPFPLRTLAAVPLLDPTSCSARGFTASGAFQSPPTCLAHRKNLAKTPPAASIAAPAVNPMTMTGHIAGWPSGDLRA
jgi:hypothetical protein